MRSRSYYVLAKTHPMASTMGVTAVVYGTGTALANPSGGLLGLLGLGTTAAVGLHAAAQWWGARRVGVRTRPQGVQQGGGRLLGPAAEGGQPARREHEDVEQGLGHHRPADQDQR